LWSRVAGGYSAAAGPVKQKLPDTVYITPVNRILKGMPDYFAPSAVAQRGIRKKEKKIYDHSVVVHSTVVLGSHSVADTDAGIISFLQKGQKAVATLLSSMMDSDVKVISNRVLPGWLQCTWVQIYFVSISQYSLC
jgi:hypothetical protein